MLWILDSIFVIHLIFIIWAAGAEIINGHAINAMKNVGKGMISLAFFLAALGHLLLGFPVDVLFKRYVAEGYRLIPILYKEYIAPVLKSI